MLKDIEFKKVEDFAVAMIPRNEIIEGEPELWDCYLFNLKEVELKCVIINTRSYGIVDGVEQKTATFRHIIDELGPLEFVKLEAVDASLFHLNTEVWVSFLENNHLFDKRYTFVSGSIDQSNFTTIPFLNQKGVMIR